MKHDDHAIHFNCDDATLLGILSVPATVHDTAVLIVVGGPQYRVGSHRQFVLLARTLADAGIAVLRFDVRGMGDNNGESRSFERVSDDIAAAIDCLQCRLPELRRIILWGLCDGASAALLYCHETCDKRISGLCLINPWVRSETSLAATQIKHYYTRRRLEPEFWRKLATGRIESGTAAEFMHKLRLAVTGSANASSVRGMTRSGTFQQRMAGAWTSFEGPILLLLSGRDLTAKEFLEAAAHDPAWAGALQHRRLSRRELPEADHTFSDAASRDQVHAATIGWIAQEVAHESL
ncbi:MAG: hydrolase 1, exosortase A system-associated [Burkholderiaceae bacterium]